MGLLAVWCEFAQTVCFYPALLGYVGSTLAYVIDQRLASNGVYTAAIIIVLFWGSALVVSSVASAGRFALLERDGDRDPDSGGDPRHPRHDLPAAGQPVRQRPWTPTTSCRRGMDVASIVLIVNSFFTYAGVEINAVHVDELRDPGREYPKSIFLAMGLVLAVFILPTLAIAWVIPVHQISFTAGVMQAFDGLSHALRRLVRGAVDRGHPGGRGARRDVAWLDGPSEGLLRIGREQGFLPPFFQRVNGGASRCTFSRPRAP